MTTSNQLKPQAVHASPLSKRMLQGAAIALVLISLLLLQVNHPHPEWGKFWMFKPLIVVPTAGAMGGAFYYFMDHLRAKGGWSRIIAHLVSLIGFIIVLWLGTVLGLNGTLWN